MLICIQKGHRCRQPFLFSYEEVDVDHIGVPYNFNVTWHTSTVGVNMVRRHPMQVSEDTMKVFQQCHESVKAKSIGRSVCQTILSLRAEIARLEAGAPKVKGPPSPSQNAEALEEQPEAVTKTDAPTPTEAGEPSTKTEATVYVEPAHHQCKFYTMGEDGLVHCAKDYDAKGLIHRVTLDVCAQDWKRVQRHLHQDQAVANHVLTA